ncbi:hypothetical protein L798_15270 [Zootermopsis nevadensis]|uniref:Uncharacterized protein n=1 Tax=Zootermopsis nevadensis TaxID=136037 RepID=A0A067QWV1_ZOONE|nr:hypothetical protein L798_15270 [Zootermopsis nevadensis]
MLSPIKPELKYISVQPSCCYPLAEPSCILLTSQHEDLSMKEFFTLQNFVLALCTIQSLNMIAHSTCCRTPVGSPCIMQQSYCAHKTQPSCPSTGCNTSNIKTKTRSAMVLSQENE